jgi:ParB/RepB/Spo0J family partition protein
VTKQQEQSEQPLDVVGLKLTEIRPSTTNPRKYFDPDQLGELSESIAKHGVLQPILVREAEPEGDTDRLRGVRYEIVAGERRYRAAELAGLAYIPAFVRTLTDSEALELQVIENLQRADLHPLEEAEGYEQLQRLHGYPVEELAAKVGKSASYIYGRLKLCALSTAAREAFYAGDLTATTALLVARIPVQELQDEALKQIIQGDYGSGPMRLEEVRDLVQRDYMLRLSSAPFPTSDPDLVPEAGPCGTCPKRTGNQQALFEDVKSPDVCTDPRCFSAKRDASWGKEAAEHQAAGGKVIEGAAAAKALAATHSHNSATVQLAGTCMADPKYRTWGQLLGKSLLKSDIVLVRDEQLQVHGLVNRELALERIGAKHEWAKKALTSGGAGSSSLSDSDAARRKKAEAERRWRRYLFDHVVALIKGDLGLEDLRAIALAYSEEMWHESRGMAVSVLLPTGAGEGKARKKAPKPNPEGTLKKVIYGCTSERDLGRVLMVFVLVRELAVSAWDTSTPDRLLAAAKRHGIDVKALRAEMARSQAPPPPKKTATKAKAASARARK